MIQVTLTFTTLDAALRVLREVPESALAQSAVEAAPAPKPEKPTKKSAPAVETTVAPTPTTAPAAVAPAPAAAPAAPEPTPAPAFEYATLQKKVFELLPRVGKDRVLEVSARHGAKVFKELPAEKWQAAFDDLVALEA